MVKLMLDNFGGDRRGKAPGPADGIECFHVNARFSNDLANIGSFSIQKILRLIKFCAEALWCRFRYGADIFYYIPAPPKRVRVLSRLLCLVAYVVHFSGALFFIGRRAGWRNGCNATPALGRVGSLDICCPFLI